MIYVKLLIVGSFLTVCSVLGGFAHSESMEQSAFEEVDNQERKEIIDGAVNPFIHALQTGNVQVLEQLIDGKLAMTLGKLLRENTEYPKFLKKRYGGTTVRDAIQIFQRQDINSSSLVKEGSQRIAIVPLETIAGVQKNFQLSLEKDTQGAWKIIDQKFQQ